jgi:signal transduction histidine kinase
VVGSKDDRNPRAELPIARATGVHDAGPSLPQFPATAPGGLLHSGIPGWARAVGLAVALAVVYGLLGQVAFWLIRPSGGAAFYPPAGFALAVLVLTPRKTWPVWLAGFATAAITVRLLNGRTLEMIVGSTLADMVEPVVGALLFTLAMRRRQGLHATLVNFAVFPVVLAPLVGAAISVGYRVLFLQPAGQQGWWYYARNWWVSDALGVLVVGSLILVWVWPSPSQIRLSPIAVTAIAAAGAAAILAAGVFWHYPVISLALPGIVWASCFGGTRAMTAIGATAALAANGLALSGRVTENVDVLRLRIGVTFLTGLFLAVEIAERRRSQDLALQRERELAASEAAARHAEAERQRLVQDLHDIVGHGLNTMMLLVGAARRVLGQDVDKARELLASSEELGRQASADLELALALEGALARSTGARLDQLPDLTAALRDANLPVTLHVEGQRGELATVVDVSAYRIVREALTNVVKHAPHARTRVTVRYTDEAIELSVLNEDRSAEHRATPADGRGIIGMRERAVDLGGTFHAGPQPGRGFAVDVALPRFPMPPPVPREG